MRLQTAIPIDEIEGIAGDDFAGFEGPEERAERRARRQKRRKDRRQRRAKRKLSRLRTRKEKLREKAGLPRKAQRGGRKAGRGAAAASAMAPAASSAMQPSWDEPSLEPAPADMSEFEDPEVLDAEWSELDDQMEEDLDGEMEGIGAFRPLRALGRGVKATGQRIQARTRARRAARQAAPAAQPGWGPNVRMGRHLRIQAALGHRAAVIDLKPGLYLVAEIPESVSRTEFGIAPLLAPLMIRAAKKAIDQPEGAQQQRRGPLSALFRRRQQGGAPLRLFRAREAQPLAQAAAPKQLTGPVASPALQPAAGSGGGHTFLLPAPNVGWADEHDVAEMLGCEACEETWR
jgi:hypothetical protein